MNKKDVLKVRQLSKAHDFLHHKEVFQKCRPRNKIKAHLNPDSWRQSTMTLVEIPEKPPPSASPAETAVQQSGDGYPLPVHHLFRSAAAQTAEIPVVPCVCQYLVDTTANSPKCLLRS